MLGVSSSVHWLFRVKLEKTITAGEIVHCSKGRGVFGIIEADNAVYVGR